MRYAHIRSFVLKLPHLGIEPATLPTAAKTPTLLTKCARGENPPKFHALKTKPRDRIGPIFSDFPFAENVDGPVNGRAEMSIIGKVGEIGRSLFFHFPDFSISRTPIARFPIFVFPNFPFSGTCGPGKIGPAIPRCLVSGA